MELRIVVTTLFGWSDRAAEEAIELFARTADGDGAAIVAGDLSIPASLHRSRTVEAVAERSLGCSCCAVRLDLQRGLHRLVGRRRPPAQVVVTGGTSTEVGPAVATILCDPRLSRRASLDSVVTVLDGPAAAVRLTTGRPLAVSAQAADQLAMADFVMVAGAADLTGAARTAIEREVRLVNPYAELSMPQAGWGDPPWSEPADAYDLDTVASRLDAIGPPRGGRGAVLVDLAVEADAESLRRWAGDLFRYGGGNLLRLQAVCSLAGTTDRWACSALPSVRAVGLVGPAPDGRVGTRVLAVGRDLDPGRIEASLRLATRRRP